MTFEDKIERGSFTGTTSVDLVAVSLPSMGTAMVQLTGTWSATVTFEVLVDEGSSPTWAAVSATNTATGTSATTATANGVYAIGVSGARRFRARCSTFGSGTVVCAVNVSRASSGSGGSGGGGSAGTTTSNAVTFAQNYTSAQTDAAVVTVSAGTRIAVTSIMFVAANSNTVDTSVRIGFGAAAVPAYGTAGIVLSHPGVAPGSGLGRGGGSATLGAGADGEDLRITCSVPTGGSVDLIVTYFTF